jgi:SagB-type dehydrogenase family enzyme
MGWQKFVDTASDPDEPELWSVFHENSKTSRFAPSPANEEVVAHMGALWESLPYDRCDRIGLPEGALLDEPIGSTLRRRSTGRGMRPVPVSLPQLAAMLHAAYGVTRDNQGSSFPRPFRTVPSGGALYPLELYVHTAYVEGLSAGLYHFNPTDDSLRLLQRGDSARQIGQALVQPNLSTETSLIVFITAIFERSIFKYGDRGYRFILLEAGHVAQNLNLAATALGLGPVNIGGFFDRDIDRLLGIDGVAQSTIYMAGIGGNAEASDGE